MANASQSEIVNITNSVTSDLIPITNYNKKITNHSKRRITRIKQRRQENNRKHQNTFQQLQYQGYSPVPIIPGTKKPAISGWQKLKPTEQQIKKWYEQDYGAGIMTKNHPVIDLDIRDEVICPKMLHFIENKFGKSLIRVGSRPKLAIICQTSTPFKKKVSKVYWSGNNHDIKNQIEILCDGQFLVVEGIHPETKEPYFYPSEHILDSSSNTLIELTEDDFQEIIDYFESIIPDGWICKEDEQKAFKSYKRKKNKKLIPGQISPIEAYNDSNSIESELEKRGDIKVANRYQYSASESGNAGISIINGNMFSHHSSDPLHDGYAHDSFEVMKSRLGLSEKKAVKNAAKQTKAPNGQTVHAFNKAIYKKNKQSILSDNSFKLIRASELTSKPLKINWIIKGILAQGYFALLIGESGVGKTFIGLDMAFCISNNIDWHGNKTTPNSVVYIAGEGHSGINSRIKGLEITHNRDSNNLFISETAANLVNEDETQKVAKSILELCPNPALIIIDTLQRNFGHGDENSTRDMTSFIRNIDTYLKINGTSVLVIHHTGHNDKHRARGSSTLKASADMEYHVGSRDELITLSNTKAKDSPEFSPMTFKLVSKETDNFDEDGKAITSAVLELTDEVISEKIAKQKSLSGNDLIVYDALKAAVDAHGEAIPDKFEVSVLNNRHVLKQHWNDQVKLMMKDKKTTSVNMAISRGIKKLLKLSKIHEYQDYYSILQD